MYYNQGHLGNCFVYYYNDWPLRVVLLKCLSGMWSLNLISAHSVVSEVIVTVVIGRFSLLQICRMGVSFTNESDLLAFHCRGAVLCIVIFFSENVIFIWGMSAAVMSHILISSVLPPLLSWLSWYFGAIHTRRSAGYEWHNFSLITTFFYALRCLVTHARERCTIDLHWAIARTSFRLKAKVCA